jgi:hypothetical protein
MHPLIILFLTLSFLPSFLTSGLSEQTFNLIKIGKNNSVDDLLHKKCFQLKTDA